MIINAPLLDLVDKNAPVDQEIFRLEKFRGLKTHTNETDIIKFLNVYFQKGAPYICEVDDYKFDIKWAKCFAGNPLWGIPVDPMHLDPFVARYINSINLIGIKTRGSCDGWDTDPNKTEIYVEFKDRYSLIWHKIIHGMLRNNYGIEWSYTERKAYITLPKFDKAKIKIYVAINRIAEYYEQSRQSLMSLKEAVVKKLKGKTKNSLSNTEMEEYLTRTIEELINER